MDVRLSCLASVALLASIAGPPAFAANFTVMVGQNGSGQSALAFNPSALTIHIGDTVTFTNFCPGGSCGFHNVDSTGGPTPFKCSVNCTSNNTPNSTAWSDMVTFPMQGTVTYQCDQHFGSGMTGTINVLSSVPVRLQSFEVD